MTREPKRVNAVEFDANGLRKLRSQETGPVASHVRRRGGREAAACSGGDSSEECLVQFAISLIHGKWKIGILSRLQQGPVRLSHLRKAFPTASKKMLTQHLREMEKDGLIVRTDLSGRLRHVEYSLSKSLGFAALHLISALVEWGAEYVTPAGMNERPEISSDK